MNRSEEILVNPYTAIRLFVRTYLTFGNEVLENRKYKVTREAWIASMFLIGISKETKSHWWLTPDRSDSPDFNCYSFVRNKSGESTDKSRMKVEVFEWRKEETETIFLEALKKIKLDKIVDPQITLVCYVRRNTALPPAVELNAQIKKIAPKVKDIWYLGNVFSDGRIWRVTQIFPNILAVDIDFDEILKTKEEHSFLFAYKGKSDKIEYESTGEQVQLSPEFDIGIVK